MSRETVDPVDVFLALVVQADMPNGLVALLFLILVCLAALILLVMIIAVSHDEEVWKREKEQLMLEKATLAATLEAWRNNPTQLSGETGNQNGKARKKMSKLQETKQMIREVGLLRTLMMVSLLAVLGSMIKTSWERVKYHFEDSGG